MPCKTSDLERLDTGLEIKSFNSDSGCFSGYASVFGNIDSHRDVVAKGAFEETLARAKSSGTWPAMLLMHGMGAAAEDKLPIGIWTEMREDSTGLFVEGKLALKNTRGRDVYELMKMEPRPALNGLSIGYRPVFLTAL